MGGILLADEAEGNNPPQPKQIQATVMFQDQNYTFMRNKEGITQQDIFDMPLHLVLIALGMLDARNYVPKIGLQNYQKTMRNLKKHFDRQYKAQLEAAAKMDREAKK
jgi:hypothetical protein